MIRSKTATAAVALLAGLALAGCAAPSPNAALEDAHSAYGKAASDPKISTLAMNELEQSRDALKTAQDTWSNSSDAAETEHYAYIAKQRAAIAEQVAKMRVAENQTANAARVITLADIQFDTNKATLSEEGSRAVNQLVAYLRDHPETRAVITGYTDSTGSTKTNDRLSIERAAVVENALAAQGIDRTRLDTAAAGPSAPVASNSTAGGRQLNRRTEVALVQVLPKDVSLSLAPDVPPVDGKEAVARLDFSGGSVAVGFGYTWGKGTLSFKGKNFPITIHGLSIADVGISGIDATANVYNLRFADDIEGTYSAIKVGVTVGAGGSATLMRNEHGVMLEVLAQQEGLQFQFAPSGVTVALQQ